MATFQEMVKLRDQYEWRARQELRLHGNTPKYRNLRRSFRVLACEVGYKEEEVGGDE